METRSGTASLTGRREANQDALAALDEHHVYVIADGMGGLQHGDRVAQGAVQGVRADASRLATLAAAVADDNGSDARRSLFEALEAMLDRESRQVFEECERDGVRMGTTLTTVVLAGTYLTVAHVGDTRCYRIRDGHVDLLTNDHSIAGMRLRRGTITQEEFATTPLKNVLYEFLGHEPEVAPDIVEADVRAGDTLLLASDGVWDHVDDKRIAAMATMEDPHRAAERLCRFAIRRGSDDNCSCVVVQIRSVTAPRRRRVSLSLALSRANLFRGMSASDLRMLAPFMSLRTYGRDELVIREGDSGDELFLVARGAVEVRRRDIALVQLSPGAHFGELALTCHQQRSASVVALEECDLVVLSRGGLELLENKRPDLACAVLERILEWVGTRLIDMTERAVKAEHTAP